MKICIVKTDRMGDMILTLPVIKALAKNTSHKIHVISSKKNYKISKQFTYIDNIYVYKSGFSNFIKLVLNLRREEYDFIYNFTPYWSSFILCWLSNSKSKTTIIHLSRNKKFLSKILFRIFASILYNKKFIIDRLKSFHKKINFHQTNIMFKSIKSDFKDIEEMEKVEFFFKDEFNLSYLKNTILIHLTARWLHKKYYEEDLISLIKNFNEKKLKVILTTDETTKNKFPKLFKFFKEIPYYLINSELKNKDVIICNNLNFNELVQLVKNISIVLTPECGLLHIAGLCDCKLIVIYDGYYYPKMMMEEYSPWKKDYIQLISTDNNLNNKIISSI